MSETKNLSMNNDHVVDIQKLTSDELFKQGKKLYVVGEYSKALEFLSKSCKMKELENGPLCDEMFEAYFYLAKGYYMYSKYDSDYIGEGVITEINGGKSEAECESKITDQIEEDKDDENIEKECETSEKEGEISEKEGETNEKEDETNEKEGETNEKEDETSEKEGENDDEKDSNNKETSQDRNDVLTYLESSYETIECAKLILMRQLAEKKFEESVIELRLADCCDLVGNIYMEEGVIDAAIDEYSAALRFREKHSANGDADRAIAESHYNVAVALSVDNRSLPAMESYQRCKAIMAACRDRCVVADGQNDEVAQLDEIIADLEEKIVDCQEGARDYELAKESFKQFVCGLIVPPSDAPVSDLTHLVRRRPANDDDSADQLGPDTKRPKSSK